MTKYFEIGKTIRHNQLTRKFLNMRGALALALMLVVLPACTQTKQEARNVTAEEVADKTNQYIGKTVTIRSEPLRKLAPNTFTMSSEQFLGETRSWS